MVITIARKKKVTAPKKSRGTYSCQFCGKKLKTEKGLQGHEKKCSSTKELEPAVDLAKEAGNVLGLTDEISLKTGKDQDLEIGSELEEELERLKSQYRRQTEEEARLQQEREELQRERDTLYKDMAESKTKSSKSILDPFGMELDEDREPPSISGPDNVPEAAVESKTPVSSPAIEDTKAETAVEEPVISEPVAAEPPAVEAEGEIPDKTEQLRKRIKGLKSPGKTKPRLGLVPRSAVEAEESGGIDAEPQQVSGPGTAPGPDLAQLDTEFGARLNKLEQLIEGLEEKAVAKSEINRILNNSVGKEELYELLELHRKDTQKLEVKVNDMAEEVGFGESLNVSKIPPSILESVYEATLADAVTALIRNSGPYDAEAIIQKILEDIRTQTSGSELFKYEEGKLRIMNLTRSLESRSISAKQIQATYSEVLKKIMDRVPGYKPKNFRAMLKIKSQEFAIDKTSGLTEILTEITTEIEDVKKIKGDLFERLADLEEARNELSSDVRVLEQKINEMEQKLIGNQNDNEGEAEAGGENSEDSDGDSSEDDIE